MSLLWPWSLSILAVVAAIAAWMLFRPVRLVVDVGSLRLWRRAADSIEHSSGQRIRRATGEWLCLLAGAAAMVFALARPVLDSSAQSRRVAIEIVPSAEICEGAGPQELRSAVMALLDRLDPADRAELLLPAVMGGASEWLAPDEARRRVANIQPIPAAATELTLYPPSEDAQRVYRFAPAGTTAKETDNLVELSTTFADATIDSAGVVERPDGQMEVFAAVRNRSPDPLPKNLRVAVISFSQDGEVLARTLSKAIDVAGGDVGRFVVDTSSAPALQITIALQSGEIKPARLGQIAAFVRRNAAIRKVAIIGRDDPRLRRYLQADPAAKLCADVTDADLVIANAAAPPIGKAALVIAPPAAPTGATPGGEIDNPHMDRLVVADDPVMRDVDFSGVAIRQVRTWSIADNNAFKALLGSAGATMIFSKDSSEAGGDTRKIFVAFDIDGNNTNFTITDTFVVFMANAIRWLTPEKSEGILFECETPLLVGHAEKWRAVSPNMRLEKALPWPGLYSDEDGRLQAVSIFGLGGEEAIRSPKEAVSRLNLPRPEIVGRRLELWQVPASAAAGLWLFGWTLRFRKLRARML